MIIDPNSELDVLYYNSVVPQVAVNTVIQDEKEFLDHIIKSTNMKCLTPP